MTKREVLEYFAKYGNCEAIHCSECPYQRHSNKCPRLDLKRIGAMAILRQNRKKFDINKILTCVTADKAKVGMKGYFGDSLASLRAKFKNGEQISELMEIFNERYANRFRSGNYNAYALFYPIDEVEE